MCECGKSKVTRRGLLKGMGAGAAALLVAGVGKPPATAQTEIPLPVVLGEAAEEAVKLPPTPALPDDVRIMRYVELPDIAQVNGFEQQSIEATVERRALLEARDLYLATLEQNEQGDLARFVVSQGE